VALDRFNARVLIVLAIDLFGFQRKVHAASAKDAGTWTLVWILLSLGLNALISRRNGHAKALKFLTCCLQLRFPLGYTSEDSLMVRIVLEPHQELFHDHCPINQTIWISFPFLLAITNTFGFVTCERNSEI
jgi:hypothetical protein